MISHQREGLVVMHVPAVVPCEPAMKLNLLVHNLRLLELGVVAAGPKLPPVPALVLALFQLRLKWLQPCMQRRIGALENRLGASSGCRPGPALVLAALEQDQPLAVPISMPSLDI